MSRLGRRARVGVFLRSFAIQGSWNYRTLIGTGFAFALLPALRVLYGADPDRLRRAVDRHSGLFNSHPYLAPVALGAVAALEAAGEDAAVIERFKTAVRGSLGTIGDRLVWAGWRPVCLLGGLILFFAGAPWWLAIGAFLAIYNAGHLYLRAWSFRVGLREAKAVGERLRRAPIARIQRAFTLAGGFLVGLAIPLAAGAAHPEGVSAAWILPGGVIAVLGVRYGAAIRTPAALVLVAVLLVGFIMRMVE